MSADANQFLRDYRNFILTVEKPKGASWSGTLSVSYTHLDVYKRHE